MAAPRRHCVVGDWRRCVGGALPDRRSAMVSSHSRDSRRLVGNRISSGAREDLCGVVRGREARGDARPARNDADRRGEPCAPSAVSVDCRGCDADCGRGGRSGDARLAVIEMVIGGRVKPLPDDSNGKFSARCARMHSASLRHSVYSAAIQQGAVPVVRPSQPILVCYSFLIAPAAWSALPAVHRGLQAVAVLEARRVGRVPVRGSRPAAAHCIRDGTSRT